MADPIPPITLPPSEDLAQEAEWLQGALGRWLDHQFIPETINQAIAARATQVYVRQRMEGEDDLGGIVIAIVLELKSFDFSESFFGEFPVANAVSELLLDRLGIEPCCDWERT
ncbi:MAG: hypothetical protein HC857_12840 [Synechococcales cyanobacterium RU_4_20]|nr:hypothetical protein [Synechococcales cyanobacterium RU_4_20]NJR69740.1 hypothetical protein [Synechococcales cyanobacterium CRU_2_2]